MKSLPLLILCLLPALAVAQQNLTPEQVEKIRTILGPEQEFTYEFTKRTDKAQGVGSGFSTSSDKAAGEIDTTAPLASLQNKGDASGGDTGFSFDIENFQTQWGKIILWVLGIACAGFGGWKLKNGHIKQGPTLIAAGAILFIGGFYPIALCLLILLGVGGYLFWQNDAGVRDKAKAELAATLATLSKVTRAVSMASPETSAEIKKLVGSLTTSAEEAIIQQAKQRADV